MTTPERDEELALYVISVAAELSGLHPQTLRIIELESAMSNMAIEVAKLRIEVDALLESNPEKALVARRRTDVIVYNSRKSL